MILLTGVTGNIGGSALKHLAGGPIPVRGLVRESPFPELTAPNISYVLGDFADPASLDSALEGVDTVFVVSSFAPNMAELEINVVEAAKRTGVRQIVQSSGAGADPQSSAIVQSWLGQVEHAVTESGLAWTILRNGTFMQNFLAQAQRVGSEGVLTAPIGDSTVTLIDAREIGAVAAVILADPEAHVGKIYDLTGNDRLSHSKIAAAMALQLGRDVRFVALKPEDVRKTMLDAGSPPIMVEAAIDAQKHRLGGFVPKITDTVERLTGAKPISFAAFLRENADRFRTAV